MYDTPENAWIQKLKGTNVNSNKPCFDLEQAKLYRDLCIKVYGFDPIPEFPLHNMEPRHYTSAHWYAKFKYTCCVLRDEQIEKERRNNFKVVGSTSGHANPSTV
jgi:hypothetical protein